MNNTGDGEARLFRLIITVQYVKGDDEQRLQKSL